MEFIFGLLIIYFIPSFIASYRKKKNANAVFLTNLFFGWTLLGWVIALIWSVNND